MNHSLGFFWDRECSNRRGRLPCLAIATLGLFNSLFVCHLPASPLQQPVIERVLTIREEGGGLVAAADLGVLEAGTQAKVTFELVNDSGIPFPIEKIRTTCSYIRVVARENEIPGVGSTLIDFTLDVPESVKDADQAISFSIFYAARNGIHVSIRYSIAGLVTFRNVHTHHTKAVLGAGSHEFRIPVLVTEPVNIRDLRVQYTDSLEGLETKLIESDGAQWLNCEISLDADHPNSKIGLLALFDEKTGRETKLTLIVEAASPISFAPSILRFARDTAEDNSQRSYSARALVRIEKSMLEKAGNEEAGDDLIVNWTIANGRLEHSAKRLSKGIFRLEFKWLGDKLEEGKESSRPDQIVGRFQIGKEAVENVFPVSYDDR